MFILISHNLTPEQEEDAKRNLQVDKFIYVKNSIWQNIPPENEKILDLLDELKKLILEDAKKGDLLLVQGDFGATYIMVNFAFQNGLVPIYATSKREVKEKRENDQVVTIRTFKHIRFRKYENVHKN